MPNLKPIAIYLPQFHPIPENDEWWGKGFTEWRNVVKGKPRFKGHYQPHLPADLGFYDLRTPDIMEEQVKMAKEYGIYGFCFYHYWFNGKRLLETPVDMLLESGKPDFPFMLCWANENWSRNWDGGFDKVLIEQKYSVQDFVEHANHLVKYFKDPRYIRINNKPVFAIYKDDIPGDINEFISAFRKELLKHNLEVYLCRFERDVGTNEDQESAYKVFNAGIEFQPLTKQFKKLLRLKNKRFRITNKYLKPNNYIFHINKHLGLNIRYFQKKKRDNVVDYKEMVDYDLNNDFQKGYPIFPGVNPCWDNSARRVDNIATILSNSTPELFKFWTSNKIRKTNWEILPERFLFINAWNEWAEGNHLEPCLKWGKSYLESIKSALNELEETSS